MPYSVVDNPAEYFNTKLYVGNGTVESNTQAITGVGFSPDLVWIKMRSGTDGNILEDSVRGVGRYLISNSTGSEGGGGTGLLDSFDSDGFTVNCDEGGNVFNTSTNGNGSTYASWSWRGSDSSAVSNTAGTITSTVSANTTSGFSIVSFTSQSSGSATVGHGLGVAPKFIITKLRDSADNWRVYHSSLGNTNHVRLNLSDAVQSAPNSWNSTSPTSTVFTLGTTFAASYNMIAYCFAEVKGFSKAFSYTGNGSSDGTFVYCGFTPAFVLVKNSSTANRQWYIVDNKRSTSNGNNVINKTLAPNQSNDESWWGTNNYVDFVSNGFKFRDSYDGFNESGGTYIGIAFASNPFVSSKGICVTAR